MTNWKYDADRSWTDTLYGFDMLPTYLYESINNLRCDFNYTNEDTHTNSSSQCDINWNKTQDLTARLNPYDLYRKDLDHEHNGTELNCANPSNCPAMKEQNDEYLTLSKYASFSRRH